MKMMSPITIAYKQRGKLTSSPLYVVENGTYFGLMIHEIPFQEIGIIIL